MREFKAIERWYSTGWVGHLSWPDGVTTAYPSCVFPTAGGDAEEVERHRLVGTLCAVGRGGADQGVLL